MGWTECGDMPVEGKADLKRYADALYSEDIHEWDGCICTGKVLVRRRVLKSSIAKGAWYGAIESTALETGKTEVWAGVCLVRKSEDGCFLYKREQSPMLLRLPEIGSRPAHPHRRRICARMAPKVPFRARREGGAQALHLQAKGLRKSR